VLLKEAIGMHVELGQRNRGEITVMRKKGKSYPRHTKGRPVKLSLASQKQKYTEIGLVKARKEISMQKAESTG
jgi:hypothetical protein